MPKSVVIYHTFETLEWGTKYYWPTGGLQGPSDYANLASAESQLVADDVEYSRWEEFDASGVKTREGSLGNVPGVQIGGMVPVHYALLLRENAPANKRPSVKYIHGYTVAAFDSLGEISSYYLDLIATFGTYLANSGVVDSDGGSLTGLSFRGFSRRTKMRQLSQ